jgi:mono/diheme cytochrome c family protein
LKGFAMRYLLCTALCLAALPVHAEDARTPLTLTASEAAAVREEMRGFLEGVQAITSGLADNDMKAVAKAARGLGMSGANHVPMSLRMRLPMEFKEMGRATHMGFDTLAIDADGLGDAGHSMKQLSETLQNCNACHASFRLETKPK